MPVQLAAPVRDTKPTLMDPSELTQRISQQQTFLTKVLFTDTTQQESVAGLVQLNAEPPVYPWGAAQVLALQIVVHMPLAMPAGVAPGVPVVTVNEHVWQAESAVVLQVAVEPVETQVGQVPFEVLARRNWALMAPFLFALAPNRNLHA